MFGHFFFWLLKAKVSVFTVFTAAKIPLIATLLVLGTTGFVVTGTIQGDEDDDRKFWDRNLHRRKTPICVGDPTCESSSPIGFNSTLYPNRSAIPFAHSRNCSRFHSKR